MTLMVILHLISFLVLIVIVFFLTKSIRRLNQFENDHKQLSSNMEQILIQTKRDNSSVAKPCCTMIDLGTMRVAKESISYISTQSFEFPDQGSPRVKIVHFIDGRLPVMTYSSFSDILNQTAPDFAQINKNQVVNLRRIALVQRNELFLKDIQTSFAISPKMSEELSKQIAQIASVVSDEQSSSDPR